MSTEDHYTVTVEVRHVWRTNRQQAGLFQVKEGERIVDETARVVVRADTEVDALEKARKHVGQMLADALEAREPELRLAESSTPLRPGDGA